MKSFKYAVRVLLLALVVVSIVAEENAASPETAAEDRGQAQDYGVEVSKMLGILINNLYTNRNIFLREVISNGSDALDKIRFMYLTNPKSPKKDNGEEPTMDIRMAVDKEKRTLTISDGGIGMTKEDLANNLGTLGASGTKNFLEKMSESQDANLIGQFGVGFYSVFLVADSVRVASKNDNSPVQWMWESKGDGKYFLFEDPRGNTLGRGTEITLELKKDADEYLETDKLKEIIHRYSEFIHFPIYCAVTKTEKVPKKKEEPVEENKSEEGEVKDEEEKKEDKKDEAEEMEEVTTTNWELINENKPIWTRKPSEITEEEYNKFYQAMSKDYEDPMYYSHFKAEGEVDFKSILYIPGKAPHNVFDGAGAQNNIRLYVRRVFITDEFKDLLPRYLSFVRGVVDSDDLPLNVSRELLQESRILKIIKKKLVRKALGMFADIANNDKKIEEKRKADEEKKGEEKKDDDKKEDDDKDKDDEEKEPEGKEQKDLMYDKFWEEFGKNIRLGLIEDGSNRARLTKLLRYKTSKSDNKWVSLDDYVDRMQATQKNIFYIVGDSAEQINTLPVVEDAIKRDVEVLYMTDAIDEYVVGHLTDYTGKKLMNLAKEGVKLTETTEKDKKVDAKRKEKYEPLTKWFKTLLGEKVQKVVLTKRLTSEPVLVTSPQHGVTAKMAKILKAQALSERSGESEAKKILELNHLHPIIDEIFKRIKHDEKDKIAEDAATVLFETACLQGDFGIDDPAAYAKRVSRMLRSGMEIAEDAALIEEDVSEYEIEEEKEEAAESEKVDGDASEDKKDEM